ncbi:MAG TPA: hypothetical protein VFN22_00170 [Gemmatimonadales bacterium]|nr:hypothetical protein [Gemmatimonadales bacterium]
MRFDTVVVLASPDSADLNMFSHPFKAPDGRWFVTPVGQEFQVGVFSEGGELLRKFGGNVSEKESTAGIQAIAFLPGGHTALLGQGLGYLYDSTQARLVARKLDGVRPSAERVVTLSDGRMLANSPYGPNAFVILDDSLRAVARFGPAGRDPDSLASLISPDRAGGFWTTRPCCQPVLWHYDSTLTVVDSVRVTSAWLDAPAPSIKRSRSEGQDRRLPAAIIGIQFDRSTGLIWIAGRIPNPSPPVGSAAAFPHGVIEAIDPATGEILARSNRPRAGTFTTTGELIQSVTDTLTGAISIPLLRPVPAEIVGRPQS